MSGFITLLDNVTSATAGPSFEVKRFTGRTEIIVDFQGFGTATIQLQGKLDEDDPDSEFKQIGSDITADSIVREDVTGFDEVRAEVTSYTSGTLVAKGRIVSL